MVLSWTVTVGPGGRAGIVRPLAGRRPRRPGRAPGRARGRTRSRSRTPATPPAGLVQETGGHAIVTREACRPDDRARVRPVRDEVARRPAPGRRGRARPRRAARDHLQQRARRRRRPPRRPHRGPHGPARERDPGARGRRPAARRRDVDERREPARRSAVAGLVVAGRRALRGRLPHRVPAVRDDAAGARASRALHDPRRGSGGHERHGRRALGGRGPRAGRQLDRGRLLPAPPFDLAVAAGQRLERGIKVQRARRAPRRGRG